MPLFESSSLLNLFNLQSISRQHQNKYFSKMCKVWNCMRAEIFVIESGVTAVEFRAWLKVGNAIV